MPTKAQLQAENDQLRERIAALEAGNSVSADALAEFGLRQRPDGTLCSPELGPQGITKCGNCDCGVDG